MGTSQGICLLAHLQFFCNSPKGQQGLHDDEQSKLPAEVSAKGREHAAFQHDAQACCILAQ